MSLRTLVLLMLVAGVLLGRYGVRRLEIARERAVVADLAEFGADVQFHEGRVTQVSFSGRRFRNEALAAAARLPRLERIVLIDTPVDDAGLSHLSDLDQLRELSVIDAPVTDAGLAHLAGLTNLRRLRLDHTRITDAGLSHLVRLTKLERLDLIGTRITDAGLPALASLTRLEQVYLNGADVTDDGVRMLNARLPGAEISH